MIELYRSNSLFNSRREKGLRQCTNIEIQKRRRDEMALYVMSGLRTILSRLRYPCQIKSLMLS